MKTNDAQRLMELEDLTRMQNDEITQLTKKNQKLTKKLNKALMWADLRNTQTGKLINVLENITTKKPIAAQLANAFTDIITKSK